jgi:hypothetical protein
MKVAVTSVDYAPAELDRQTPFTVNLIRQLPGSDRPDYWLGELERPLLWLHENIEKSVTHVIIAARWQGTQIGPGMKNLPIGLAYVTDSTQLDAPIIDFSQCKYVAIGTATQVDGSADLRPPSKVMTGRIAPGFGTGKRS